MVKQTFQFSDQQWHLDHKEDLCSMTAEGLVNWHKTQCDENVFDLFCHKGSMGKRICTILLSNACEAEKKERLAYFLGNLGLYIPLKEKHGDSLALSFFTPPPPSITLKACSPVACSLYNEIFTAWEKAKLGKYINIEAKQPRPASVPILEKEEARTFLQKPSDCWF